MINYTLPDFTVGLGLNLFFIRLLERARRCSRTACASTACTAAFPRAT